MNSELVLYLSKSLNYSRSTIYLERLIYVSRFLYCAHVCNYKLD